MAAMQGGNDQSTSRYLIENVNPKEVREGVDYELTQQEVTDGELVNVKMTPQTLASLMGQGSSISNGVVIPSQLSTAPYTPTRPELNRFAATKIAPVEQELDQYDEFDDFYQVPATTSMGQGFPCYQPTPLICSANVGGMQANQMQCAQNALNQLPELRPKRCSAFPAFSSRLQCLMSRSE